jgi:hypothetical protein
MNKTPNYVLAAVKQYKEEDCKEGLINQFENGIPLHSYQESRELIIRLLEGKKPRAKGESKVNKQEKLREWSAACSVAALSGAGLTITEATQRMAEMNHYSESKMKRLWAAHKDCSVAKNNYKMGKQYPALKDDEYYDPNYGRS